MRSNRGRSSRFGRWAILLLGIWAVTGCDRSTSPPKNVLLLTLDTTRVDGLSCYGQTRVETPHLDRLAADGVRFERAYSCSPVTLPSHASILTGTYPIWHGARNNGNYRLDPRNQTLAEILGEHGYETAAFIASFPLVSRFGTDQGFETYDDDLSSAKRFASFTFPERDAATVVDSFCGWLEARETGAPFFSWVHFFDPHAPSQPPAEFARRFSDPYLAEIAYVDQQIGRVVETLREEGLLEETLVVVVGDHGEGLRNPHDEPAHGLYLYDETIRVPFLATHADSLPQGRVVEEIVSTVDIVPTVLDLLGLPPAPEAQGVSLLAAVREGSKPSGDRLIYMETVLPHYQFGWSALCAIRDERWKYIRAPKSELYRIDVDPREGENVVLARPEEASRMALALEAMRKKWSRKGIAGFGRMEVDSRATKALTALGYLQGSAGRESAPDVDPIEVALSVAKDPKDLMSAYVLLEEGRAFREKGDSNAARRCFEEALGVDPENLDVLGDLAMMTPDSVVAEKIYREMLVLAPKSVIALYGLGFVLEAQAREVRRDRGPDAADSLFKEAEACYLRVLELDPFHHHSRINLGNRYCATKRFDDAEKEFLRVLEIDPGNPKATRNLTVVYIGQNRHAQARDALLRIWKQNPKDVPAGYNLALSHERLEEFREALEVLERLRETRPDDPDIQAAIRRVRERARN